MRNRRVGENGRGENSYRKVKIDWYTNKRTNKIDNTRRMNKVGHFQRSIAETLLRGLILSIVQQTSLLVPTGSLRRDSVHKIVSHQINL
jgi:hypothetical protein